MKGLVIDKSRKTAVIVATDFGLYEVNNSVLKHSIIKNIEIGEELEFRAYSNIMVEQRFELGQFIYFHDAPF